MKKHWFLLCIMLEVGLTHGLNPIFDASNEFRNLLISPSSTNSIVMMGNFYSPQSNQKIRVPFTYFLPEKKGVRLSFGLKSRWLDEPNNVRHIIFGAQYSGLKIVTLNADFLWGVANFAGDGLTVSAKYSDKIIDRVYHTGLIRVGFFDALVWHPDFSALQLTYIPEVMLHKMAYFEFGTGLSTQLLGMGDFLSWEILPGLKVLFNKSFSIHIGTAVGLAGPQKTNFRIQLTEQYVF